jgi:hypothetical protein
LWNETKPDPRFFDKATNYPAISGGSLCEDDNEKLRKKFSGIVFPDGVRTENERVDVEAIFVAKIWCAVLITNDGASKRQPRGILGSKEQLHREVGVQVMRPEDAVEIVKNRIASRDKMEMADAVRERRSVASWHGKD